MMCGPEPFLPICEKKCRSICNTWLKENVRTRWNGTTQCSITRSFMASPNDKTTSQLLSLDKLRFSYIVGVLTGHIRLNAYLRRIQVRDDPDCDFCGRGEETSLHFLCNCPALSHIRRNIFGGHTADSSSFTRRSSRSNASNALRPSGNVTQ